jgi:PHD/YefM family antitoxin component YafN of YafNO toxin-antitoxin module
MPDVLASTEARDKLPAIIAELLENPTRVVEVGRQRRREVVLMSAAHFDALREREEALRDLAWAEFAAGRIESPTSEPVSWEEAQRRRRDL